MSEGYADCLFKCDECGRFFLTKIQRQARFCGVPCAQKWHTKKRSRRVTTGSCAGGVENKEGERSPSWLSAVARRRSFVLGASIMRHRHVAAVTLLGWGLMMPPLYKDAFVIIDPPAPSSSGF